ncbi:MAG: helix-turn-helix domain-containing protein, partial [Anaerolineae bacterium]|nr:helix-turn-helix domain-containing protein [Anaerolineae bacterium]
MSGSYAAIYNKANCAASQTFSPTVYRVLMMLTAHANGLGVVCISQSRLAEHIRRSAALVNRAIPNLIEAGCIAYQRRGIYNPKTKRMFPNIYQINPDILHLRPADLSRARELWEVYNGKPLSLTYDGQPFPPHLQPEQPDAGTTDEASAQNDHVHPDVGTTNGASAQNDHVYSEVNEVSPTTFTPPENPPDTTFTPRAENPKKHVYSEVNEVTVASTILPSNPLDTTFTLGAICLTDLTDHIYSEVNVSSFKDSVVVAVVQTQEKPPQQSFVVSEDIRESKTLKASSNEKTSDDGLTPPLPDTTPQQPDDTVQSDSAQNKPAGTPTFQTKTADDGMTPSQPDTTPPQPAATVESDSAQSKLAGTPAFQDQVSPDSYQNDNSEDNLEANTQASAQ